MCGLLLPVKTISNNMYPSYICKTNFQTFVIYKDNYNKINTISSSNVEIFCSTNKLIIKSSTQYNSYNMILNTTYDICIK